MTREQLEPNPDFVLNHDRYRGAQVLVTGDNFGCGSSREHAVWALTDYGFRAIIAPGFADIFSINASKNGLLLVTLPADVVSGIARQCESEKGYEVGVNLSADKPHVLASGERHHFEIDAGAKERLLGGLDEIAVTELMSDKIRDYEARRREQEPWIEIGPQGG